MNICCQFCQVVVDTPNISNATARVSAWLIGAALATGGFPIELSIRQITDGFARNGKAVRGTGSRPETIRASIKWLEDNGYLSSTPGGPIGFGHFSRIYTLRFQQQNE